MFKAVLTLALSISATAACAQSVALSGRMGERALLVIDGKAHTVAPGASAGPVKLLRWQGDAAEVSLNGKTLTLQVGGTAQVGVAAARAASREIVLTVGPGGHFMANGKINGKSVNFMVDTGATLIAMGRDEAQRLGIDMTSAKTGLSQTANGPVQVQVVTLSAVRVGDVEVANVAAVVTPQPMPYLLLGNSFLGRFQMQRNNDVMRLTLR
jgi:aspartyl protease family protein